MKSSHRKSIASAYLGRKRAEAKGSRLQNAEFNHPVDNVHLDLTDADEIEVGACGASGILKKMLICDVAHNVPDTRRGAIFHDFRLTVVAADASAGA
jgi:hypothetical protein